MESYKKTSEKTTQIYRGILNGQLIEFSERIIPGDGDCAFTVLELSRSEVVKLLLTKADDLSIRRRFAPEIKEAFINNLIPRFRTREWQDLDHAFTNAEQALDKFQRDVLTKRYPDLDNLTVEQRIDALNRKGNEALDLLGELTRLHQAVQQADGAVNQYAERQEVYVNYIELGYGNRLELSYEGILTCAEIRHFSVYIWLEMPLDATTGLNLQLRGQYIEPNANEAIHFLHKTGRIHFNRLISSNQNLTLDEREAESNTNASNEEKSENKPVIMTPEKIITWGLIDTPVIRDQFNPRELLSGLGATSRWGRNTAIKAVFLMASDEARHYQQRLLKWWMKRGTLVECIRHYGIDLRPLVNQPNIPPAFYTLPMVTFLQLYQGADQAERQKLTQGLSLTQGEALIRLRLLAIGPQTRIQAMLSLITAEKLQKHKSVSTALVNFFSDQLIRLNPAVSTEIKLKNLFAGLCSLIPCLDADSCHQLLKNFIAWQDKCENDEYPQSIQKVFNAFVQRLFAGDLGKLLTFMRTENLLPQRDKILLRLIEALCYQITAERFSQEIWPALIQWENKFFAVFIALDLAGRSGEALSLSEAEEVLNDAALLDFCWQVSDSTLDKIGSILKGVMVYLSADGACRLFNGIFSFHDINPSYNHYEALLYVMATINAKQIAALLDTLCEEGSDLNQTFKTQDGYTYIKYTLSYLSSIDKKQAEKLTSYLENDVVLKTIITLQLNKDKRLIELIEATCRQGWTYSEIVRTWLEAQITLGYLPAPSEILSRMIISDDEKIRHCALKVLYDLSGSTTFQFVDMEAKSLLLTALIKVMPTIIHNVDTNRFVSYALRLFLSAAPHIAHADLTQLANCLMTSLRSSHYWHFVKFAIKPIILTADTEIVQIFFGDVAFILDKLPNADADWFEIMEAAGKHLTPEQRYKIIKIIEPRLDSRTVAKIIVLLRLLNAESDGNRPAVIQELADSEANGIYLGLLDRLTAMSDELTREEKRIALQIVHRLLMRFPAANIAEKTLCHALRLIGILAPHYDQNELSNITSVILNLLTTHIESLIEIEQSLLNGLLKALNTLLNALISKRGKESREEVNGFWPPMKRILSIESVPALASQLVQTIIPSMDRKQLLEVVACSLKERTTPSAMNLTIIAVRRLYKLDAAFTEQLFLRPEELTRETIIPVEEITSVNEIISLLNEIPKEWLYLIDESAASTPNADLTFPP